MTDADLIYNALLRAERRMEALAARDTAMGGALADLGNAIIKTIREEVGNGLAKERR
jgi:hypothetical protein